MYNVEKHRNDFDRSTQLVKICNLTPLKGSPVDLWEESICGHFFRAVLYIGDSGKYFASVASALNYLEEERKRRNRKKYRENPVKTYYTE